MRIIISPAKKMRTDTDSFACRGLPVFLDKTEQLCERLQKMSGGELRRLWKCNDQIAEQNIERLRIMDLRRNLTPAILSYVGIQYQYMAPGVLTADELEYVEEHLRILSGFYGILRPFDGVTPYRLEMQAKLAVGETRNLYDFWGACIAEDLLAETDCIIDLASKEYSRCVTPYLTSGTRIISCVFGERKNGKIVEKGTQCKMARGEMVRYMAERQIREPGEMRAFDRLGYRFSPKDSGDDTYVFVKESVREADM